MAFGARTASGTLVALVAASVLSGCSRADDSGSRLQSSSSSPSGGMTSTGSPSESPAPTMTAAPMTTTATTSTSSPPMTTQAPSSSGTPSTTRGTGSTSPSITASSAEPPEGSTAERAEQAQIPAHLLPGYNDQWVWQRFESGSGSFKPRQPSVCLQASLTSIGAVADYRTSYSGPGATDTTAFQMTAVFPDEQTAQTASQVLVAWHNQCHAYASRSWEQVNVGGVSAVPTVVGPGSAWLTTYKPVPGVPHAGYLDELGFVLDGDTMTVVVMLEVGQDYDYPAGHTPVDEALRVAGRYLVRSR